MQRRKVYKGGKPPIYGGLNKTVNRAWLELELVTNLYKNQSSDLPEDSIILNYGLNYSSLFTFDSLALD